MGLQIEYLDSQGRATGPNAQDPGEFRFIFTGLGLVWRRDTPNVEHWRLHDGVHSDPEADLGLITVRRLSRQPAQNMRVTAAWVVTVTASVGSAFHFSGVIEGMRGDAFEAAIEIARAGSIL